MTSIGLISDVHAAPDALADALMIFERENVEYILCAGDIAGYNEQLEQTVSLLVSCGCKSIMGNHDLLYLDHVPVGEYEKEPHSTRYLKRLPATFKAVIEGKKLYMVHAEPPDSCHGGIKLLDKTGQLLASKLEHWGQRLQSFDYDVLVVGHTHQIYAEMIAETLVINPGSSAFNNSCAVLKLPSMKIEFFALNNKAIEKTWNWGEHVIYGKP